MLKKETFNKFYNLVEKQYKDPKVICRSLCELIKINFNEEVYLLHIIYEFIK